jgi:hypothetical protein
MDELEQIEAAWNALAPFRLVVEPRFDLDARCRCGSCWAATGELIVGTADDQPLPASAEDLLVAAPAHVRWLVAEAKRLRAVARAAAWWCATTAGTDAESHALARLTVALDWAGVAFPDLAPCHPCFGSGISAGVDEEAKDCPHCNGMGAVEVTDG